MHALENLLISSTLDDVYDYDDGLVLFSGQSISWAFLNPSVSPYKRSVQVGQESFSTNPAVRLYRYDVNTGEASKIFGDMLSLYWSLKHKIENVLHANLAIKVACRRTQRLHFLPRRTFSAPCCMQISFCQRNCHSTRIRWHCLTRDGGGVISSLS